MDTTKGTGANKKEPEPQKVSRLAGCLIEHFNLIKKRSPVTRTQNHQKETRRRVTIG